MTQRVIPMTSENTGARQTRDRDELGSAVQLEFPDMFLAGPLKPVALSAAASNIAGTDIISKSDLAMMRGRRERHAQQKRNER
jgi:hypothetical protein